MTKPQCGAIAPHPNSVTGEPYRCNRPEGHAGPHKERVRLRDGVRTMQTWEDPEV